MILAVALVSIIFSIVIFFNNLNRNSNYLAGFFFIIGVFNVAHYYVVIKFDPFWAAMLYNHFAPFYLLLGPLLFFYLRGIIEDDFIFKKSDWWHFVPFFIMIITVGDYYFQPFEYKKQLMIDMSSNVISFDEFKFNYFFPQSFNFLFRGTLFSFYLGYNFYLIFSRLLPNGIFYKFLKWGSTINWVVIFHFVLLLITVSYSVFIINFVRNPLYLDFKEAQLILGLSSFGMVSMNVILLFFPHVLYGITRSKESKVNEEELVEEFKDEERKEYFLALKGTIDELAKREKLFLLEEFSMEYLSKKLEIPIHHVRIVFKDYFEVRFIDYKNQMRVHHAIGLLKDNLNNALTIEAIGQNSGFNSRSTFFATFKKITGKTPLEFISN